MTNGSFETDNFSGWTLGGNDTSGQMYINGQAESGSFAAALGSVGSDGTLSQTLQTTAGQQYTLSFWLANNGSGPDDITAKWNGATVLALTNAPAQGYTEYTFTVTATGSTSTLEFDARQDPSHWSLDNISVTPVGTVAPTISSIAETPSSGDLNAGKTVTYTIGMSENVTVNTAGGTPTAGAQRWRHRHLCQRLGHQCADLQLHGGGRSEHTRPDGDGGQSQRCHDQGRSRQCRQPVADRHCPGQPADRYHGADGSAVAELPSSGDLNAGKTVTLTLNMSENVTVNTAGGKPTLALNDGSTASYTSGSGTVR